MMMMMRMKMMMITVIKMRFKAIIKPRLITHWQKKDKVITKTN